MKTPPVDLYEGITTTRAIRRYTDDPIPTGDLRDIMFAATRAPSGSNRQPFRFIVLTDTAVAAAAKALIGRAGVEMWSAKRSADGYDVGSGARPDSPKQRMAATMQHYVDHLATVPVLIFAMYQPHRPHPSLIDGASVYPACQNLMLAARALGYGGVLTGFHESVEPELRTLLHVPDEVKFAATITLGVPAGSHGPVRRRPLPELVFGDRWGDAPDWAIDPPGTAFTAAGPPRSTPSSGQTTGSAS